MNNIRQVSDAEFELMKIIWKKEGVALYAQIIEELELEEKKWKKNTILVLLSRLVEKGLLSTNKVGHRNKYIALFSEKEYLASQTKMFLDKMYEGNAKNLVSTLVQQDFLTSDDYEQIKKYWKDKKNKD